MQANETVIAGLVKAIQAVSPQLLPEEHAAPYADDGFELVFRFFDDHGVKTVTLRNTHDCGLYRIIGEVNKLPPVEAQMKCGEYFVFMNELLDARISLVEQAAVSDEAGKSLRLLILEALKKRKVSICD